VHAVLKSRRCSWRPADAACCCCECDAVLQLLAEGILQHKVSYQLLKPLQDKLMQQAAVSNNDSASHSWLFEVLHALPTTSQSDWAPLLELAATSNPFLGPALEVGAARGWMPCVLCWPPLACQCVLGCLAGALPPMVGLPTSMHNVPMSLPYHTSQQGCNQHVMSAIIPKVKVNPLGTLVYTCADGGQCHQGSGDGDGCRRYPAACWVSYCMRRQAQLQQTARGTK